jgi:hypothetical protein
MITTASDARHVINKLRSTIRIATCIVLARTFYEYSGWDGEIEFARYRWRGKSWKIPKGSIEE